MERDDEQEGGAPLDRNIYWRLVNMPPEQATKEAQAIINWRGFIGDSPAKRGIADRRAAHVIVIQNEFIPFKTQEAADQFAKDRGMSPKETLVDVGGVYFVALPREQRGPIGKLSAPVAAPIVARPAPVVAKPTTVSVTNVATEVNPKWPPPK